MHAGGQLSFCFSDPDSSLLSFKVGRPCSVKRQWTLAKALACLDDKPL